jgi:hypothetical protein
MSDAKYRMLSSGKSFAWMGGNFEFVIDHVTTTWLDEAMSDLRTLTKALCHKKTLSYAIGKYSPHAAYLVIVDPSPKGPFTMAQWAFDDPISIPSGGIEADDKKSQHIQKPHEKWVFRQRNYVKFKGAMLGPDQLPGKGFVSAAIRQTFTKERLDGLGEPLATVTGAALAWKLRMLLEGKGYKVEIT